MHKASLLLCVSVCLSLSVLSGCAQNPSPVSTATTTTPAQPPQAAKAKPAIPKAEPKLTAVGVKTIKPDPTLKAGKKLSPQEVEDLIRRLSVCHPV